MSDHSTNDEFTDPLENYEPRTYADPLEEAIAEEPVANIQHHPHASIHPDESVAVAVRKLAAEHVACLLVEDNERLVGVFTDREVLNKVALEPDQQNRPVREFMTDDPVYVYAQDPAAAALCVMAVSGHRHVPVVDSEERVVGIVSPQRVTRFLLNHVTANDEDAT